MFGEKCAKCGKRIRKSYEFCPFCGWDSTRKEEEGYGFLGTKDFEGMDVKMPFGLNMFLKPLMKELNKQMVELDKEVRREKVEDKKQGRANVSPNVSPNTNFSISIGMPGQKPIHISSSGNKAGFGIQQPQNVPRKQMILPKIADNVLEKIKKLPRKEPNTGVRRLADRIVYEIDLPGVKSVKNVNVSNLEIGIEIKAFTDKEVFVKTLELKLPLLNYYFEEERLVLEMGLR